MRLLIIAALAYLAYRWLKSWTVTQSPSRRPTVDEAVGPIDDVMVKDPFCEAYFPKRSGVRIRRGGEDVFFCSEACRDQFLADRSGREV